MSTWEILGIAPTSDERAIKQAYAKALKHNKPDKNPEGFKALRKAYETALATRYYYADDESDDDDEQSENHDWQEIHINDTTQHDFHENELSENRLNDNDFNKNDLDNNDFTPPQTQELPHDTSDTPDSHSSHGLIISSYTTAYDENLVVHGNTGMTDDDGHDDELIYPNGIDEQALSDVWHRINHDENIHDDDKDNALLMTLQEQAGQLYQLSLDERMSYEQELLEFFVWHDEIYPKSYEWVFHQFGWQSILDSWQVERYPWYHLSTLQERYKHVIPPFDNYQKFYAFLSENHPIVAEYYNHHKPRKTPVFLWHFIEKSFYPERLLALSHELSKVNALLLHARDKHHTGADNNIYHNILKHDKEYTLLNTFVFKGVFQPIYLIFAFIGIALAGGLLSLIFYSNLSWFNRHVLPITLFVFAMLIFWQLRWHLFVYPQKFCHQNYDYQPNGNFLTSLYISLPVIFIIMFFSTYQRWKEHEIVVNGVTNITELYDKPSYFIAHLMGFGIWYTLMRANRYHNPFVIQGYWIAIFIFFVLAIFYPSVALLTNHDEYKETVMAYTPLFWVPICIPIAIHLLANNQKINPFHPMANFSLRVLVGFSVLLMFFAGIHGLILLNVSPLLGVIVTTGIFLLFKSFSYEDNNTDNH